MDGELLSLSPTQGDYITCPIDEDCDDCDYCDDCDGRDGCDGCDDRGGCE